MFMGGVCIMSRHEYSAIWVDPNSTYLVNV